MFDKKEISDEELKESIEHDSYGRNKDLSALMKILNSIPKDEGYVIALDGDWGSGKTVLIRQLGLLWKLEDASFAVNNINIEAIKQYRNNYLPFYYNAWENDFSPDASESLLLRFSDFLNENDPMISNGVRRFFNSIDVKGHIKNVSKDLIDLGNDEYGVRTKGVAIQTINAEKVRNIISETIEKKLEINPEGRILLIVDELDRCRPEYTVKIIESIKHNFNNRHIVVLVAINYNELGNIIKGYYGGSIDGHRYLDRIFDFKLSLSEISIEDYLRAKLGSHGLDRIAIAVARHLKMTMREMNHFAALIRLMNRKIFNEHFINDKDKYNLYKYVFAPLFVGYKIHDPRKYYEIANQNGVKYLIDFGKYCEEQKVGRWLGVGDGALEKIIEEYYNDLFKDATFGGFDARDYFWNLINMIYPVNSLE